MSGSKAADASRVEELAKTNPKVDGDKVREVQEAIEELRRGGVLGPSYGIASPYERKPPQKTHSSVWLQR
jgi:hypothetical protein